MDTIQNFYSNIERIKRRGPEDARSACSQIADFFVRDCGHVASLARAYADYWIDTYILASGEPAAEPTDGHLEKLAAMRSLLVPDADGTRCLDAEDWQELYVLTSAEAGDLPLDFLNDIMAIFVDRRAVR